MERDEETGFNYHGARYYAVWLGRWCSCDPIRVASDNCFYAYVRGNPIRLIDPDGRQDTQAIMRGMMWDRLGQEISGIIEGFFGGRAWVSPQANKVLYSGPRKGVGGVVGGAVRAGTLRVVPIEENPSQSSLLGMEFGAPLVPFLDSGTRLVMGTTVTGQEASRAEAAVQFGLEVAPFVAESAPTLVSSA